MTRYVGVDLHRRRSVIVVLGSDGTAPIMKRLNNPNTRWAENLKEVLES